MVTLYRKIENVLRLRDEELYFVQLDLADLGSNSSALEHALEQTEGRLNALFNNAACGEPRLVENLSYGVLYMQFEINVFDWYDMVRLVLPKMLSRGSSRIQQNRNILGLVAK